MNNEFLISLVSEEFKNCKIGIIMENTLRNEVPSLISRESSTAIKGLLLLLVVFGHTSLLSSDIVTGERTALWYWLYTFHVYVFFILPVIYGYKRRDCQASGVKHAFHCVIDDIYRNALRVVVPFLWFSFFYLMVFILVGGGKFELNGVVYALVFGNEPLIGKYIGFNFLWFLPAYMALVIVMSIWYNSNRICRICIAIISLVLWSLYMLNILNRYTIGMYVPFALSQGLYFITYGLISRWLLEGSLPKHCVFPFVIIMVIGITVVYLYFRELSDAPSFNVFAVVNFFMPVLIFLLLYVSRDYLSKSRVLKTIGKYSLQIYLVHVFIINALATGLLLFFQPSIGLGFFVYLVSILISLGVAKLLERIPWLNGVLFPKAR